MTTAAPTGSGAGHPETSAGSDFDQRVVAAVGALPRGVVVTYGDIAREIGHPGAARAVGSALGRTEVDVPWWRVVPASGRLATHLVGRQARHLRAEGIDVVDGRITGGGSR